MATSHAASRPSITSENPAVDRTRRLLARELRPIDWGEEWEEQRRLLRQKQEHRAVLRWVPASSVAPDIPVAPLEPGGPAGDEWQQFELPEKELALVEVGTAQEIRRIIRESLEKQLAAREEFLQGPLSGPSFRGFEPGQTPAFADPTDDGDHPTTTLSTASSASQHMRQDSDSSSGSASSGIQSNGSSIRDAGLTPSTSRSSNSSREALVRYPKGPARKNVVSSNGPLWFIPSVGLLSVKNKMAGSGLISPRAIQIKKLWKEKMSEGECASCMDGMKNRKLVALQCQHKYCSECFSKLIATALMDESYFPPRCCLTEIPVKVIQGRLSFAQKAHYRHKAMEYAVPAGDRLFCPYPACSRWNPPSKMVVKYNMIKCRYCRRKICFTCKGEAHGVGADCPQDFALEATLRQAQRSGWRRCFQCKNMVEKQSGCIHITCKCKAQFCYTCGEKWKTCPCTEEHEAARLQALQQQGDQEDEEAASVAAAITEIERQQREEMEGTMARAEEEARGAARREEECLREDRLQLERKRRQRMEAKERVERIESERLKATAAELEGLWTAFHRVHRMQLKALLQRHGETNTKLAAESREAEGAHFKTYSEETAIETQHMEVIRDLQSTHATALQILQSRQGQEEDDYFTGLHARLSGELNRNKREYAVLAELRAAHAEARNKLLAQQDAELSCTNAVYTQRLREMQNSARVARDAERDRERKALEQQKLRHTADRMWFDLLVETRTRMLEDLEAQMVSPPPTSAQATTGERAAG